MTDYLNIDPDNRLQGNNKDSGVLAMLPGKLVMCRKRMESLNEHTAYVSEKLRALEKEEKQNTNHCRWLDVTDSSRPCRCSGSARVRGSNA